jgi:hypothetical protein
MKRFNPVLLTLIAVLLVFNIALNLRGIVLNAQAGSPSDPLVSQSYVDAEIAKLRAGLEEYAAGLTEFTPVFLSAGQVLEGGGGCEIVLRSGRAAAYVPLGNINGILDVPAEADITHGTALRLNALIIIPRADGRGVRAQTDAWFMVKGSYTIQP